MYSGVSGLLGIVLHGNSSTHGDDFIACKNNQFRVGTAGVPSINEVTQKFEHNLSGIVSIETIEGSSNLFVLDNHWGDKTILVFDLSTYSPPTHTTYTIPTSIGTHLWIIDQENFMSSKLSTGTNVWKYSLCSSLGAGFEVDAGICQEVVECLSDECFDSSGNCGKADILVGDTNCTECEDYLAPLNYCSACGTGFTLVNEDTSA